LLENKLPGIKQDAINSSSDKTATTTATITTKTTTTTRIIT